MKKLLKTTLVAAAYSGSLHGATYYTTVGQWGGPTDATAWNDQADGLGTAIGTTDYSSGSHSFVFQAASVEGASRNERYTLDNASGATNWNTQGITIEAGAQVRLRNAQGANFTGGDITVGNGVEIVLVNNHTGDNAAANGGMFGDVNLQLDSSNVRFHHAYQGVTELALNVVGSGTLTLQYGQGSLVDDGGGNLVEPDRISTFYLSALTADFTGSIDANAYNGRIQLAEGNGAINAHLQLGRVKDGSDDKDTRLILDGNTSIGSLQIHQDGNIADGSYTYADLVDLNASYEDHFIDEGGTLYIGVVAVPEPSSSSFIALGAASFLLRRKRN